MRLIKSFLNKAPRYLFFTGKGGVGKTSMACVTALGLADQGKQVLLISTDPASNLDEVLETSLSSGPAPVKKTIGLYALNIDPIQAAAEYRERMVGPYRGVLPEATPTHEASALQEDLRRAQRQKLALIAKKLNLSQTDHLLDIGCGWGGLARYAAREHGCRVTAVNISKPQLQHAQHICDGLPVFFHDRDYRKIDGQYDKIVSGDRDKLCRAQKESRAGKSRTDKSRGLSGL